MSRENADTVVRVIGAINRRDVEAALRELGDDAEYIDHRASSREHFRGHEAFRATSRRSGKAPTFRSSQRRSLIPAIGW